jgi:hypothetical protein
MTEVLKPCPFCKKEPFTCKKYTEEFFISCNNPNCFPGLFVSSHDGENTIQQWNMLAEGNESKWVKFDPEDESTWPAERTRVWVISKKRKKIYIEHFWKGLIERYSHWMEIKYPEPPEQE